MKTHNAISTREIRENFPFLLWASGLAVLLVIGLTVVAFYFSKMQRDADEVQIRSSAIIRLVDSITHQLEPSLYRQKRGGLPFDRLRALASADGRTVRLAEKIYRTSTDGGGSRDGLLTDLGVLHNVTTQLAATENTRVQAERIR